MKISSQDIRNRVEAVEDIGTLPHVMARILHIVNDDSSTALDLANEIANDQSLTMSVLRTVNSAYYGFQRQILTVPESVVLLGFNEVERIALAIMVIDTLGLDRESIKSLRLLWRHSVACAVVGSYLEQRFACSMPELRGAHVGCLLHDIGKAVIAQYIPEAMPRILQLVSQGGCTMVEAEAGVLDGCTHAEIGAIVARKWQLPEALVEGIAFHHSPTSAGVGSVHAHATHLADYLCNTLGYRAFEPELPTTLDPVTSELYHFDDGLLEAAKEYLAKNRNLIGAIGSGAMA